METVTLDRAFEILKKHKLSADSHAAQWLLDDLEIAADCRDMPEDQGLLVIPKEAARPLAHAAARLLDAAARYGLATPEELAAVRGIRSKATKRAQMNAPPGVSVRPWLWQCCENFLVTWTRNTNEPAGVYDWDEKSPALLFLVDCCRMVDPTVNASAILKAREVAGPALDEGEQSALYEKWFSGNSGEDAL